MPINGMEEETPLTFLGSVFGDHVKIGINTAVATGSVFGFGSHVTVAKPPKFVPSFAWLSDGGMDRLDFDKAEAIAANAMSRRGLQFTPAMHELFVRIAGEWSQREQFNWAIIK
jgi:hypothetical protein